MPRGPASSPDRFEAIIRKLRKFRAERNWDRFDTLKDLAAAIAIETSELQQILLWEPVDKETELLQSRKRELAQELADIMIHCLNFADRADIDPLQAIEEKIRENEANYPVSRARRSPRRV
jgi:NTP pyrophosphatase (non-canonical NTP hydrolase)